MKFLEYFGLRQRSQRQVGASERFRAENLGPAVFTAIALLVAGGLVWWLTGMPGLFVGAIGASMLSLGLLLLAHHQHARR